MKKANSAEPAKYLPELAKLEFAGSTGKIAFDDKGDRKDAEMTIFTMKDGKLAPVAIIKGGKTIPYDEFVKAAAAAPAAPAAPAAAAPAAEPKKDEAKKDEAKK